LTAKSLNVSVGFPLNFIKFKEEVPIFVLPRYYSRLQTVGIIYNN